MLTYVKFLFSYFPLYYAPKHGKLEVVITYTILWREQNSGEPVCDNLLWTAQQQYFLNDNNF